MKKFRHPRLMKVNPKFVPCEPIDGENEFFPNGIFVFNISRILSDIESGKLVVSRELINVTEWSNRHYPGVIHEEYMPKVILGRPIIHAEIRHDMFELIDGHHRMEKAKREGLEYIESYKLMGEQLPQYLTTVEAYVTYINCWNDKLEYYP